MNQLALTFDRPAAIAAGELGMSRSLEAVPEWVDIALEGIRLYCMRNREFKTEEFRKWWIENGYLPAKDHHVWGGLTQKAMKAKIIEFSRYERASSVATHGHPVGVYRSLVMRGNS